MPNRILRDAALDSDRLAAVSESAEVLFYRLIMLADDFGRFDGRVSVIRSRAFALRQSVPEEEIAARLEELSTAGLICTYSVLQKPYLYIPRFGQRQRAEKSKFPDPVSGKPSNDGQTSVRGQTSAHVVVVGGVVEDGGGTARRSPPADPVDTEARKPWWKSNAGIDAMGKMVNIAPRPGEGYPEYKDRLFEALKARTHARGNGASNTQTIVVEPEQGYVVKVRGKFDDEPEEERRSGT